jgi:hypothetical protein
MNQNHTVVDSVAVNFKTGKDASGLISLRSAIQAAIAKSSLLRVWRKPDGVGRNRCRRR